MTETLRRRALVAALLVGACTEQQLPSPAEPIDFDLDGPQTAAQFLSCLEGQAAIVSAHRGGAMPLYPENAIESALHVLDQVPALIELDVRETRDGVLVLMHDETVDRTTTGQGAIADMTLAELKELFLVDDDTDLTTKYRVPTLAETLEELRGRTVLQLDVKRGVGLRQVTEAVEAADAQAYAAIITYTDQGALMVADTSDSVSVFVTVRSTDHLDELVGRGLPREQMIAWTGIVDERPLDALYQSLGERAISTSGGALGRLDGLAEDGRRGVYQMLEDAGLDIIATDRPFAAAQEIGTEDVIAATQSCAG
ncbi:MAG: glycerophosphodiester phosphodiesterase family protein [Pseudomonadota bacterium]